MNGIGASILAVLIIVVLFAPRRWALLGMMGGVMYLTQRQAVEVLGVNLFAVRFLEMAGFTRVMLRREYSFAALNEIDRLFLLFFGYTTTVFLLRSTEGQVYQVGLAADAILCYCAFRGLVGGVEDFRWFLKAFLLLLAPFAALVLVESSTSHNPFSLVGGMDDHLYRNGRPRSMGSFRHPILLGTFAASFLPLYLGQFFSETKRTHAVIGIGLCLWIVWLSNSGGPVIAAVVGIAGWFVWIARRKMSMVITGTVAFFILLALVMKAPIWYLPAKVSALTGGTGWHRSYLMDSAIKNLDQWWFAGMPVQETRFWLPYTLAYFESADITNQYLSIGINSGIISILLFLFLLALAFRRLGKTMPALRLGSEKARDAEFMLWGLGVMLFVHVVNWFGVSYFDQIYVVWFMQLAAISTLSNSCEKFAFSQKSAPFKVKSGYANIRPLNRSFP